MNWTVVQLLSKLCFFAGLRPAQAPESTDWPGKLKGTPAHHTGNHKVQPFPQLLPSVGHQECTWSSRDLRHRWGEVGGWCSRDKAGILSLLEREWLQSRLSLQNFIYNYSPLLVAGWGTANCCCAREGTWGPLASGWAMRAACQRQSLLLLAGPAAGTWMAVGWDVRGSLLPCMVRGPCIRLSTLVIIKRVVVQQLGSVLTVSTTVDLSSPFLQQKIAFWWNMSIKEGNAFTTNEGFMESSKGLATQIVLFKDSSSAERKVNEHWFLV